MKIHYIEDGTPGKEPLFLLHWFMGSHQTWYDIGWVRVLSPYFRLILLDHRGYGQSTKLYKPSDYQPQHHVNDIKVVMNKLGIDTAHFFGYSMGGRIAFALATYAPNRVKSLIIGGMHPYSSERIPTDMDQRIRLLKQGMEATLTAYGIGPDVVFARMLDNDADALLADTIQTKQWIGLADKLKDFDKPILLFVGTDDGFYDGVKEISLVMKNARFIAFRNENHRTAFLKRTLLLPHLKRFYRL